MRFYRPSKQNLPLHEEDLTYARQEILSGRNNNLDFLLRSRYLWMKDFIDLKMKGLEIGAGAGASRKYMAGYNLLLSDISTNSWIDYQEVDAHKLPFGENEFDYLILNNVFHHLAFPSKFLDEAQRVLRSHGVILIMDTYSSLMLKIILRLTKHEGFDDDTDPMDESTPCNDPYDPWSANNSLARLLVQNCKDRLEMKRIRVEYNKVVEFIFFLNSGG